MSLMAKEEFFRKYDSIEEQKFDEISLSWEMIEEIYEDYVGKIKDLEVIATNITNLLMEVDKVHSIRKRVKDPEHLIEKIIRKSIKKPKLKINVNNYSKIITDLIGIRILHLFKEDWVPIHKKIMKTWNLNEKPQANIRKGDREIVFKENHCEIKEHKYGYRSVHYLIKHPFTKDEEKIVEIQVRTLFEEAWSEIDHQIRYPYDIDNPILAGYLVMFNGLAGSADEMGGFIKVLKQELDYKDRAIEERDVVIKELQEKINLSQLDEHEKEQIHLSLVKLTEKEPERTPALLDEWNMNSSLAESMAKISSISSFVKNHSGLQESLSKITDSLKPDLMECKSALSKVADCIKERHLISEIKSEIAYNLENVKKIE
ncbi:MAG: GTP pyrophosphokinase [Marinisporobacter sp.]|jgi:ppGpp synthetase/RelA/SpoT-type nucleotidyltranferase|nr:GTP pyrophosphokinase [Marinisporobacter sp.]